MSDHVFASEEARREALGLGGGRHLEDYVLEDDLEPTCANGCPDGARGQHKLSCDWAGRQWFVGGYEVRVTGESPDGATVCVRHAADQAHAHVARCQVTAVRYPEVHVQLTGTDGNTLALTSLVGKALRRAGHGDREGDLINDIFTAKSYDDALHRLTQWVSVS